MSGGNPFSDPDSPTLAGASSGGAIGAGAATKAASGESSSDAATIADVSPVPLTPPGERVPSATFFIAGTLLGSRYQILRVIGQGGMGAVYQARDQELDRI